MYESKKEYDAVLHDKVVLLEWSLGHPVRHLEGGHCPRCGDAGQFDLQGLGFSPQADNSIYYSTVYNEWRCRRCDFRMCA